MKTTTARATPHPTRAAPACGNGQGGVTLLEVLIAILIISFGMLGMAGMQSVGMKQNLASAQRTAATLLANDMADRMRANMVGVNAGAYDGAAVVGGGTEVAACTSAPGCSAAQMAQNDVYEWNRAIVAALGAQGQGIVCRDNEPNDGANDSSVVAAACVGSSDSPFAIKIWWLDDRSEANAAGNLKLVAVPFKP